MCEPTTIAIAAIAASTAMGAYGQIQAGNAAQKAATANNAIAQQNAIVSDRLAANAEERGRIAEQQQRMKTSALMGRQQAVLAAKGIDISSGTPLDILAQSAEYGEMDALTTRYNFAQEAAGYRQQASNQRFGGQMALFEGKNAKTASRWQAMGTLVSGAGKIAGAGGGGSGPTAYNSSTGSAGARSSSFSDGTIVNWN